ncbi:MAG: hemolysin family protein [Bacteroidetes bacterium]|nr:hemolysin family protein [Bacteroidota bacterium]
MDSYTAGLLVIFIICLAFSFVFSGAEVAFFSLKEDQISKLRKSTRSRELRIAEILSDSQKLLVTILIGNNLVNVMASVIAATLTYNFLHHLPVDPVLVYILEVFVLTFIFLILSEITPKIIGAHLSLRFAVIVAPLISFLIGLFTPVTWLVMKLTRWIRPGKLSGEKVSNEDLKTIADVVHEHGSLAENEKEMISSLADFSEKTVREIMISRVDMVAIESDAGREEVMETVRQSGHSRIPVYLESLDQISGILYAKDLIPFLSEKNSKREFSLQKLQRQPLFIPEGKKVSDLLKEFQIRKMHIAIVVDEYGGTAGMVTLDDVISEIIGEIRDEHDEDLPLYRQLAPNVWSFDGKTPVDLAEEVLGLTLQSRNDGFETLAGFILSVSGAIPKEKAVIRYQDAEFIIEKVEGRRIAKVKVILRAE